jgi:hypothetical protein
VNDRKLGIMELGKIINQLHILMKLKMNKRNNYCGKTQLKKIYIQGVSEISTLILTGNRTHQKEQLVSLPFWRKTLRSGLKK